MFDDLDFTFGIAGVNGSDFSLKLLIWPDFAKFSKILKKFDKTSPKRRLSAPLRGAAARGLEEILPCSGE